MKRPLVLGTLAALGALLMISPSRYSNEPFKLKNPYTSAKSSREVPIRRTPETPIHVLEALRWALGEALEDPISDLAAKMLLAQWAHETAEGASMFNWNMGGQKGASPEEGTFFRAKTTEGLPENELRIVDKFRAFSSITSGALDFVMLHARRYPGALRAASAGDVKGFIRGLQHGVIGPWFTGSPTRYEKSVGEYFRRALSL